jgi:hypothetical protein
MARLRLLRVRQGGRQAGCHAWWPVVILAVCVTTAGCVPYWTWRYYEPSAPGGNLAQRPCPVPPNTLEFTLGDVKASVFAYQDAERPTVGMHFSVPAGHGVRLLDAEAVVHLSGRPETLVTRFAEIAFSGPDGKPVTMPVSAPMAGASRPAGKGSSHLIHRLFTVETPVPTAEMEPFTVDFPRFSIDDHPTTLPRIAFALKRHHMVLMMFC